ncbi:AfsR/SARP family transcriptional regulator [Streptomyces sp. NBC_01353]|uniref:AfsR/SARP family transcriptional regulator n=1 Tax=Streptomyces sp. NBC_01353 TaxID=2903835 RepID=UPI002E327A9A|nr:BTAD domain-containing putative transcriptional regulator [Streptomyces sp. NBC_01353]
MLQIRLLGPVEVHTAHQPIPLGGGKPRALLAALALEQGHVISTERLIDVVWEHDPPDSARALIQTYISTLRRAFSDAGHPEVIASRKPGYAIRPEAVTVDAAYFAALLAEARRHAEARELVPAAALLLDAVALWRGPALSGVEGSLMSGEAGRLDELRVTALEERFGVELALGRLDHLAELTGLVARYPANERLRGQLMVTLYRLGRQADALACYREGRAALVEELGIEPGQELGALHDALLRGDGDGSSGARALWPFQPHQPVRPLQPPSSLQSLQPHQSSQSSQPLQARAPAHLPPAPADFTGRTEELATLTRALTESSSSLHVVAGPGGSGKSTLAAYAAHQVTASFPDGQLHAELRGLADSPAEPAVVLGRFLRSLGVNAERLPDSLQERTELYRTLLADRRLLIVLDDAADERQVRPLLPGGRGCTVLVTSRDRLGGLSGARLVELDVLAPAEALELLTRIVGPERVAAEPQAAADILSACGNLPLAIRIAGARLATRSRLPLKVLADRLTDERRLLDELAVGDLAVRSTIGLSFQSLDRLPRAALERMGFFGLPEFSPWVVGRLLDVPEPEAQRLLELLVDTQLVTFAGVDRTGLWRYRLHDLVRIFAREQAETSESAFELFEAVARVFRGWISLLHRIAASSPSPQVSWRPAAPQPLGTMPDELGDRVLRELALGDAFGWFDGDQAAMAVAVDRAAAIGLDHLVCDLVSAYNTVDLRTNHFGFRTRITGAALAAARRMQNQRHEAAMLAELAQLCYDQDRFTDARCHFSEALSRFRALRDVRGQAFALAGLGTACREPGRLTEAVHFLDQAAALLHALDDHRGVGHVLRTRASVRLEQGEYGAVRVDLDTALDAFRQGGSRRGLALTLRSMGLYHRAVGEYEASLGLCAESAAILAELGDEFMHSYAVRAHAKAQMRLGHRAEALPRLEGALATARDCHDRFGQAVTLRVIGQLHLADERFDLARSCLDAATSMWDAMDTPLWRARTEYDLSLVHEARGETGAALAARTHALVVFREHGAREYAELNAVVKAPAGSLKGS